MKCPNCGADNHADSAYCIMCGSRLVHSYPSPPVTYELSVQSFRVGSVSFCSFCGASLASGSLRCSGCGRWLGGPGTVETSQGPSRSEPAQLQGSGRFCASCRIWWPNEMTFCQKCGGSIDPSARKPKSAELPMIIQCSKCGAKNMRTEAFCGSCDENLEETKKKALEDAVHRR